ncbi:hypothetical protein Q604_UNBC13200G0001, partial [human gut metagenome]
QNHLQDFDDLYVLQYILKLIK